MNPKVSVTLVVSTVLSVACSNQQAYDAINQSNEQQCYLLPASQVDDCLARNDISFEEYQRQREALLNDELEAPAPQQKDN